MNLAQRPFLDFRKFAGVMCSDFYQWYIVTGLIFFSYFITFVAAFNYRFMYGIFTIKLWVEKGK